MPDLEIGAGPSTTSSITLVNADSIVTADLGTERDLTYEAQNAKSTEYDPFHNTGASDTRMKMAVNLDMMLFVIVNQSNIITINLDKMADSSLHAVTYSMIITWTGRLITNNMNCTGTVTTNDLCNRSLNGDIGASTGNMEASTGDGYLDRRKRCVDRRH